MPFSHKYYLLYRDRYLRARAYTRRGVHHLFRSQLISRSSTVFLPSVFDQNCNTVEQVILLLLEWERKFNWTERRYCVIYVVQAYHDIFAQISTVVS